MAEKDISVAFTKQFQSEVKLAYQQSGSKLRNTVRTQNNIVGASTVFNRIGKGTASTKARHGLVPVMSLEHGTVECLLSDYYAGDWVDALDEKKTTIDERKAIATSGAYALGRKSDALIIDALKTTKTEVGDGTTGLTKALILEAFAKLNSTDVPDDGQRFGIVGAVQWNELLGIEEFTKSDYAGDNLPFLKGTESRKWLGINWILHTGLPLDSNVRSCFVYHKTAVGHASGQDIKSDITWHGDHASHFIDNMMSQGACLIDGDGVVKIKCKEAAAVVSEDDEG